MKSKLPLIFLKSLYFKSGFYFQCMRPTSIGSPPNLGMDYYTFSGMVLYYGIWYSY